MVQLFSRDGERGQRPAVVGCGVLVRREDRILVFSAAHVLAEFKNKPAWMDAGEQLACFPGEYSCQLSGSPEMGNHERDRLDAAVCLLPPAVPADLARRAIDIRKIQGFTPTDGTLYMLLGYPANRTDIDQAAKDIVSERMPLVLPELRQSAYTMGGYSRETHIMLEWRNEWKAATGTRRARRLSGSSGAGIWAFVPGSVAMPQLVATFTEVTRIKGGKAYIGTRIVVHLQLARDLLKHHQELRYSTPGAGSQA